MSKAAELAKMGEVLTNSQIGGRRNIVINGAMNVAQRATSATGVGASDNTFPCVDRMKIRVNNTAGRATISQVADVHDGFANALKFECTTADTSIAADEFLFLQYSIEGQDLQQLKKGTSDAEKFTISFYVKGNANATYTCDVKDHDNSRFIGQEFSVTSSWSRVTLTFNNETSNALDDDNGNSLRINIWLHGGSTYTGGTFSSNTWHTTVNQRLSDSQTSFFDSTDRTFFITGLQMEVGSQATPFEHRSFGEELLLCQRYYEKTFNYETAPANSQYHHQGVMAAHGSSNGYANYIAYKVQKRAAPTMTTFGSGGHWERYNGSTWAAFTTTSPGTTTYGTRVSLAGSASTENGKAYLVKGDYVADAEL
jgi:hypothetical protein